jgi:hypothetical protein
MLDNRAKPRLSSRGCGAANALLTGCARYGLWEEPGRRNGALTRTKKLIFKRKKDARSPADFADENWASPKLAAKRARVTTAIYRDLLQFLFCAIGSVGTMLIGLKIP